MKSTLLFPILFIFNSYLFCQKSNDSIVSPKKVSYYRVKEIINSRFGGSTTTYTASSLSLIKKTDLGPGNQRIITPVYKTQKSHLRNQIAKTLKVISPDTNTVENTVTEGHKTEFNTGNKIVKLISSSEKKLDNNASKPEKTFVDEKKYVYVNVVKTLEVVANKGYKSVKIFKEIADSYYFKKDFDKAVIWYDKLFSMKPELESNYYYRYGDTLIKTGKITEGNKLMQKFYSLNVSL